MSDVSWNTDKLRQMLISQQEKYHYRGLEHALFAETNAAFYHSWIYHRLIILSLIPEEFRKPGIKVVDVDGGKGRMVTLLSDLGLKCVNIDRLFLDEGAKNVEGKPLVPLLRSYCEKKGVKVLARDVLLEAIPYPEESFDLAICSEVIEHLPNSPKPMLLEIYRTLVKDGYLILTTPNAVSVGKRMLTLFGRSTHQDFVPFYKLQRGYPAGTAYRGHIREYTRAEVEQMLIWENFTIIRSEICDFQAPTGFRDLIRCWLHGHSGLSLILKKILTNMGEYIVVLARK